ncbi:MFS transporter [Streptomyces sp. NPDC053750]|uniref:MFS transporter n=1 Tax=Streptomyces sp. NPDC053750 TaxID=3365714 RepID=UPI0037D11F3F
MSVSLRADTRRRGMPPAPAAPGKRPGLRPGAALAVIASCNAMIQLDEPIVNIALPGMRADLGLSPVGASWVLSAYLLAFGGLLLLGGRAGDILGRRRVFLTGVAVFTAAAAARAFVPPGEGTLIAVRAVQGLGAACAAPSGLALLLSTFAEGPARRKAIAVCTAVGAVSTAGGLLLAGALTSLGSWRWVLLLNVPLGVAILLLGPRVLTETPRNPGRFDVLGALLSAAGAACLVYALARAADHGWSDPAVALPLLAGLALLAVFTAVEARAEQPVVVLRLFADRDRLLAYLAVLAVPGALAGAYFFLSQSFQQEGLTPLATACVLLPVPLTMALTAGAVTRLEPFVGPKRLMALGAAALALANLMLASLDDVTVVRVLPALVLLGSGMACCVIPPTVLATSRLRGDEAGAASSVLNALQALGGSLGIALLVTASSGHSAFGDARSAGFTAGSLFAVVVLLAALAIRRPARPARRPR